MCKPQIRMTKTRWCLKHPPPSRGARFAEGSHLSPGVTVDLRSCPPCFCSSKHLIHLSPTRIKNLKIGGDRGIMRENWTEHKRDCPNGDRSTEHGMDPVNSLLIGIFGVQRGKCRRMEVRGTPNDRKAVGCRHSSHVGLRTGVTWLAVNETHTTNI
ncbi:hypothetical protein BD779DRAFT_197616 [Infundibulicybe gibba]|nr:hypothetical protein BD779DRAFT_197616 [Infundibulicybe gibba]